jgi:hypothetical protein
MPTLLHIYRGFSERRLGVFIGNLSTVFLGRITRHAQGVVGSRTAQLPQWEPATAGEDLDVFKRPDYIPRRLIASEQFHLTQLLDRPTLVRLFLAARVAAPSLSVCRGERPSTAEIGGLAPIYCGP